jgi:exopolysaccharide biosynthesis WecB/TagA/CpsF family protein
MTYDALPQMGVPIHHRDLEGVLDTIDGFVGDYPRTGRARQVVTVNTDFLVQAHKHEDVHAILRSADLAIPDGMPIVWASAALGQRLPSRIAGADLVELIAERAALNGYRLMLFGGADGAAERAAALLRERNPGLVIATADGVVSDNGETDPKVLEEIRNFRPAVICVALGHPKQERWIRRHGAALSIPVGIGVGATFDFITGERARAAGWIQRAGFEWLFRLAQEPGRLTSRYMADFTVYVPRIVQQIGRTGLRSLSRRFTTGRPSGIDVIRSDDEGTLVALSSPGPLDRHTVAALTSAATQARRQGRTLRLVAPGLAATRSIQRLRLDGLMSIVPDRIAGSSLQRNDRDASGDWVTPTSTPVSQRRV